MTTDIFSGCEETEGFDQEASAPSESCVFFDYLGQAYRMFLSGEGYEELEEDLSSSFKARNEVNTKSNSIHNNKQTTN